MAEVQTVNEATPKFLYKILSKKDWEESQKQGNVKLDAADDAFIHFSREDQLERITGKYWAGIPEYYILKIDTEQLPGRMAFETNPGGSAKYYHLYNGSIPVTAVIDAKCIKR